eukprot:SAG11_NODE_8880_length_967_cov_1.148618_1_plen_254_part_01
MAAVCQSSPAARTLTPPLLLLLLLLWGILSPQGKAVSCDALAHSSRNPFYCSTVWAKRLAGPRAILVTPHGEVLLLDCDSSGPSSMGAVLALWDADGDGLSGGDERAKLVELPGLIHGLGYSDGYLYASSDTTVFRWPYHEMNRFAIHHSPQVVVRGMRAELDGAAAARSIVFDAMGRLYISGRAAAAGTSARMRVRRFGLDDLPASGLSFEVGEIFSDGLGGIVSLAFDTEQNLWGVEQQMPTAVSRGNLSGD